MKLSHWVTALSLAAAAGAGSAATLDLSSGSTGFSATPVAGGFTDIYTFEIFSQSYVNASVTSVLNGAQDIDFVAMYLTGPSGVFSFDSLLSDPVETWSLATPSLNAGTYTLSLIGLNSAGVASYGGNIAVSAVPEPETYAMLLAGIGAIGFLARRRRD